MVDQGMPAPDLLALAEHVALGKQASFRGRHNQAIGHFRAALAIENRIPYMEPPWWYYPVNQSLGAALYRAGKYDEARQAFTAALAKYPTMAGLFTAFPKPSGRRADLPRRRRPGPRSAAPGWVTRAGSGWSGSSLCFWR
jgi:tetratricopeptide (TPR) repeat protein